MKTHTDKRVLVIQLAGKQGKTTITKHVLTPLLPDAAGRRLRIETANTSAANSADIEYTPADFTKVADELFEGAIAGHSVIVDVGSSNATEMRKVLSTMTSIIGDLDLILIPTMPMGGGQDEALKTIDNLKAMGYPLDKMAVVLNGVASIEGVGSIFQTVIAGASERKVRVVGVPILDSKVFELLKDDARNVFDVVNEGRDFRDEARKAHAAGDRERLEQVKRDRIVFDLSVAAAANIEALAAKLFK